MSAVSAVRRVKVRGSLAGHADGFEVELRRLGFTPLSIMGQLRLMAHLSRWLDVERVGVADLSVERVESFLRARRSTRAALFSRKALSPLLGWLAVCGVIPEEASRPAARRDPLVLDQFELYLLAERRLQSRTAAAHVARARRFMVGYCPPDGVAALTAADVTRALLEEGANRRPVSVKKFGYTLRAFLRFCFLTGLVDRDLTGATLVVRSPQPSLLPVGVSPADVETLLGACDRETALGRREYAVIVLLARLGLRAGEVAGLRMEDIDWHLGEILIRGKGAKDERLPLPAEVGEAVADYLVHARPADTVHKEVFCTARAPRRRLTSPAIWAIVQRACDRGGIQRFGPHRLRHSLGEAMVAAEVPLAAIGQVLRHENPLTTAGYARVDVAGLRSLALSWPTGGGQS
jgi:integrase/recombinase XerD